MITAYSRFLKNRYFTLALAFLINAALGSGYSYGVFRPGLEEHWGLGAFDSGLPYMVFLAFFALTMPFGGALIEKAGERRTIFIGASVLGAGWILAGFSDDIRALAAFYGILGGGGVGLAYGAPLSLALKLFPDRKGLAMGVTLAGFGLSPLFSAPLIREAVRAAGPVAAFALAGTALAASVMLLAIFLRKPPAHPHAHTPGGMAALPDHDYDSGEMVRSPRFYALWISFAAACAIGLSVIGMTPSFAMEVGGMSQSEATALLMIFAAFNALGRPVFGYLSDRAGPGAAGAASFFLIFSASAALSALPMSRWLFLAAFAVLWFNLGAWLAVAPAATAFFFGLAHQPRNYGIVYTAYGAGAVAGVSIASRLKEATGTYSSALAPMAAAALLMAVFSGFFLRKKREDSRKGH